MYDLRRRAGLLQPFYKLVRCRLISNQQKEKHVQSFSGNGQSKRGTFPISPSMNARVNVAQHPKQAQWTFEHRLPAPRIRSIGTVRPVRTLVGSFRMRQRVNFKEPTKPFYPKHKKNCQSCLRNNAETVDTVT